MPANDATPPMTGPSSAPNSAAPIALPSSRPRDCAGESATSHASAATHEHALAAPCRKRASSISHTACANANRIVVTTVPPIPSSTVRLTPSHEAASPAGTPNTMLPSANIAARTPAPDFDSPSVCA